MAKDKDNTVVHTEARKNGSLAVDFGLSGSRIAKATLGDGRTGTGTGSSDASAKAAAIKDARRK